MDPEGRMKCKHLVFWAMVPKCEELHNKSKEFLYKIWKRDWF
jgi:hypothetical protein